MVFVNFNFIVTEQP